MLPENLLRILNNGLRLEHVVPVGVNPEAAAPGLRRELLAELTKHILVVDQHPTLTRMWTFGEAVDNLLCFSLIGGAADGILVVQGKNPRAKNAKR